MNKIEKKKEEKTKNDKASQDYCNLTVFTTPKFVI